VLKGCIDALQANYPAVARLVGDEWFRAAAAVFARAELPAHPTLLDYGAASPAFSSAFAPAGELPTSPTSRGSTGCWTEAHVAADALPLDPAALAALTPEADMARPFACRTRRRAGAGSTRRRSTRSGAASRAGDGDDRRIDWHGEGALLTRPFRPRSSTRRSTAPGVAFARCLRARRKHRAAGSPRSMSIPGADFAALIAATARRRRLFSSFDAIPLQEHSR
jgi:hypothetical protein